MQGNKCTGCGLCSILSKDNIEMEWKDGFLYPTYKKSPNEKVSCSIDSLIGYNSPKERYVAYHKLLERRMDGSAGGVYGAILETIIKEDAFITGTVYDDHLKVHHVLTKDPEHIKEFAGYKPTQSDPYILFPTIKELLDKGSIVLFGGLPCQVHALKVFLKYDYENLYLVDVVCNGIISQDLIDTYARERGEQLNSDVVNIRYNNKEFSCADSKRIYYKNGRVYYTKRTEPFDLLMKSDYFVRDECKKCQFSSLDKRVGDITIGHYSIEKHKGDGKGVSYLSVNTEKGKSLFEKTKKRLIIVQDASIRTESVGCPRTKIELNSISINTKGSIQSMYESLFPLNKKQQIKNDFKLLLRVIWSLKQVSGFHIRPLFQFVKFNFFTKGVETDFKNNGFIYIAPYSEFSLEKDIKMVLHGPLTIGLKRIHSSKLETRLRMKTGAKFIVYDKADIGGGSNIEIYKDATLEIGDLFSNAPIVIICGEHIKIGSPVNIARGSTVRDTNGHLVVLSGYKTSRPVEIGNHVWICSDSTIMPGVKIGDGSIVGACSYVSQRVNSFELVQGNPAMLLANPEYFIM